MPNKDLAKQIGEEVKSAIKTSGSRFGMDIQIPSVLAAMDKVASKMADLHGVLLRTGGDFVRSQAILSSNLKTMGFSMDEVRASLGKLAEEGLKGSNEQRKMLAFLKATGKGFNNYAKLLAIQEQVIGSETASIDLLTQQLHDTAQSFGRDTSDLIDSLNNLKNAQTKMAFLEGESGSNKITEVALRATAMYGKQHAEAINTIVSKFMVPTIEQHATLGRIGLARPDVSMGGAEGFEAILNAMEKTIGARSIDADALDIIQQSYGISEQMLGLLQARNQDAFKIAQDDAESLSNSINALNAEFSRQLTNIYDNIAFQLVPVAQWFATVLPSLKKFTTYFVPLFAARLTFGVLLSVKKWAWEKTNLAKAIVHRNMLKAKQNQSDKMRKAWQYRNLHFLKQLNIISSAQLKTAQATQKTSLAQKAVLGQVLRATLMSAGVMAIVGLAAAAAGSAMSTSEDSPTFDELQKLNDERVLERDKLDKLISEQKRVADAVAPSSKIASLSARNNDIASLMLQQLSAQLAISEGHLEALEDLSSSFSDLQSTAANNAVTNLSLGTP
jgi:hypothetical protein